MYQSPANENCSENRDERSAENIRCIELQLPNFKNAFNDVKEASMYNSSNNNNKFYRRFDVARQRVNHPK